MKIGDRIRRVRKFRDITQGQLGEKLGMSQKTVSNLEKKADDNNITLKTIKSIAKILDVNPLYLSGLDERLEPLKVEDETYREIKIYGSVPAGKPIEAMENIIGHTLFPDSKIKTHNQLIALKVTGNSMYPKYYDGDTIIIELTDDINVGDDIVVYINDYDTTLKQFNKDKDGNIVLHPLNPEYMDKVFKDSAESLRILGRVIHLSRDI